MVYNWDLHQPKCYRLYIVEKKSLEEIMDTLRVEDSFTPSKRAFQTQFRRWNFPSKQNPAHKDERLVARVKELWEKNLSQNEMVHILNEEDGFDIKRRELMRLRTRHRWLLRTPNTDRPSGDDATPSSIDEPYSGPENGRQHSQLRDAEQGVDADELPSYWQREDDGTSDQKGTRKRPRRTRVRPAPLVDSSTQPRFPSETTIDESRLVLGLDAQLYQEMRTHFARICDQEAVSKKTIAGPERWDAAKSRLVQEIPHLQSVMWAVEVNTERKKLAVDVICTDVTKRMRSMEQKLTIADTKSILCINPEEYRTIRQDLVQVLRGDYSVSKTEAGPERWEEMKEKWRADSSVLQGILAAGPEDDEYDEKIRAVDVIARDVLKRLRDGQSKQNPIKKPATKAMCSSVRIVLEDASLDLRASNSPDADDAQQLAMTDEFDLPTPAQYPHASTPMVIDPPNPSTGHLDHDLSPLRHQEQLRPTRPLHRGMQHRQTSRGTSSENSVLPHSPPHHQTSLLADDILVSALPIDPQITGALPILIAGHNQPLEHQHAHSPFSMAQNLSPNMAHSPHPYVQNPYRSQLTPRPPVAVYLRLHPSSAMTMAPSIWIATLTSRTFDELRQVAVKDFAGMVCSRVEGILGENMTIEVSRDDELTAYLAVVEGRNSASMPGPPCFYVQILPGGWKT